MQTAESISDCPCRSEVDYRAVCESNLVIGLMLNAQVAGPLSGDALFQTGIAENLLFNRANNGLDVALESRPDQT